MSNEMIIKENGGYLAAAINLGDLFSEEMDGLTPTFDRIKIPAGGGISYEVPGDDPSNPDSVKEFKAVILYHHPIHSYYKEKFTGGNNPPDCGSMDGKIGVVAETGECKNCATCPYAKFGSGDNGGMACKQKRRVPYLYSVELPTFEEVVKGKFFDELDPDEWNTCRYACADSDWTLQLYHTFNEWFDYNIPRHRFICEEIESPTAVYTGMMKYNGVGVDAELMEKKRLEAEQKIMELREKVLMVTGDIDIGTNCSTAAFKAFLYKTEGLPVLKTTAKFQDAADDQAMQLLMAYCKKARPELVMMAFARS